jgi:hypothetical protein
VKSSQGGCDVLDLRTRRRSECFETATDLCFSTTIEDVDEKVAELCVHFGFYIEGGDISQHPMGFQMQVSFNRTYSRVVYPSSKCLVGTETTLQALIPPSTYKQ